MPELLNLNWRCFHVLAVFNESFENIHNIQEEIFDNQSTANQWNTIATEGQTLLTGITPPSEDGLS